MLGRKCSLSGTPDFTTLEFCYEQYSSPRYAQLEAVDILSQLEAVDILSQLEALVDPLSHLG